MRKFLAMCLTGALCMSMLVGCGSKDTAQTPAATDAQTESTTKTFTVGFDAEYPPYGYMDDNGDYVGFDLDLAEEVCNRLGWELVKQPIDWDAKDMELNSGTIDCIWSGFTITGREADYEWSAPYVDNSIVFVVMNDSDIQSKEDLAGKIVVTQADSSALAALEEDEANADLTASFADLQQVADYNTAFLNLESGVVDCIAVDIGVAQYQINSRGETFRALEEPLSKEQYGVGFKLGNTELRDDVQSALFDMYNDGTVQKIAEGYQDFNLPDMICIGDYIQ